MRLPQPFYKLPLLVDAARLRSEIEALPASAWAAHPNAIAGNSSLRLISSGGGENDDVNGPMLATPHLAASRYLRQVLARFGVVWSRSRLMGLAPGAEVPEHADINLHWFYRVRLHIPVVTRPEVRFICDGTAVHMAAGEVWLFDNWRRHRVENPTDQERIHLVADTTGSAAFWRLVAQAADATAQRIRFDPSLDAQPLTERSSPRPVMPPAEVELLVGDLRGELTIEPAARRDASAERRLAGYHAVLDSFCRDWRQLYALHGEEPDGYGAYESLRDQLRGVSREHGAGLVMRTNAVAAHAVLEGRLLRHLLAAPVTTSAAPASSPAPAAPSAWSAPASRASVHVHGHAEPALARIDRPVFIVSAPRSGSTLLYETLAASGRFATLGGEAHWLIEEHERLRPGAPGVDSNRLTASHLDLETAARIVTRIHERACSASGDPLPPDLEQIRLLEKTPKNSLRIPYFNRLFPDARFVFLWRDPRENLASIIEAWRAGRWITYPRLDGWDGPWSMLLPPGWKALRGRPLAEVAAFQWEATNRIVLDDLQALDRERWIDVEYAALLRDPGREIRRIASFARIDVDAGFTARLDEPLPLSRYTLAPPSPDKWRAHEAAICALLPSVDSTWARLRALHGAHASAGTLANV